MLNLRALSLFMTCLCAFLIAPSATAFQSGKRVYKSAERTVPVSASPLGLVVHAETGVTLREHFQSTYGETIRIKTTLESGVLVVLFENKRSKSELVSVAERLEKQAHVLRVKPLLGRQGSWAATGKRFIVRTNEGKFHEVKRYLENQGARFIRESRVPNTLLYEAGSAQNHDAVQASIQLKHKDINSIEPDLYRDLVLNYTPNDPLFEDQWHLSRTGRGQDLPGFGQVFADLAWDITRGSPDITIAVVDSGTDLLHEDLAPNARGGFDAIDGDDDPSPGCSVSQDGASAVASCPNDAPYRDSHGTSVSGVAVARGDNALGGSGACPECSLMAVRLIGGTLGSALTVAESFIRLADEGADVINNSWGPGTSSFFPLAQAERDAFEYVRTRGRNGLGCVVLFASGNNSANLAFDPYAKHPSVIGVGASTLLDDWAIYSNYGDALDIVAPSIGGATDEDALGITTADVTGAEGYADGDYNFSFGGTSSASPLAAGVAGLVLSANPNLTSEQVRLVLTSSADKITATVVDWQSVIGQDLNLAFAYDENNHSIGFGYGRINAQAAVQAALLFTNQGALCAEDCARCTAGLCELSCESQADCIDGTVCQEGICVSPAPALTDVGEPCDPDCAYCTPALDSRFEQASLCSDTCENDESCPTGFACRAIAEDTKICVIESNGGARNFGRECLFGEVVRDQEGKGYCSESCTGSGDGDCPYGYHCAAPQCTCSLEANFGCLKYDCEEGGGPGDWPYEICFPDDAFGLRCESDLDCGPSDYCFQGECKVDDRAGCEALCSVCSSDEDCGPFGDCVRAEGETQRWCSYGCELDRDCPGDSVCGAYVFRGNRTFPTCRKPGDATEQQACSAGDYVCTVDCREDLPCTGGLICEEGACVEPPEPLAPDDTLGFLEAKCNCFSGSEGSLPLGLFALLGLGWALGRKRS